MKTCRDIERLLTPYIDGEATADESSAVDEHVAVCDPCRHRTDAERAASTLVRERADDLREPASSSLHARCRAAAASPFAAVDSPPAPVAVDDGGWRPWGPRSLAAAAVLFLAVAVGFFWLRDDVGTLIAAELAIDHVKCFALTDMDAVGANPSEVSRAFAHSYGWTVDVPAGVESEQLELIGARRCAYHDGQMAHVLYRLHGEPMSLFVLPQGETQAGVVDAVGHQAVMWGQRGQTYAVVGQENPATLQRIATYVRTGSVVVR